MSKKTDRKALNKRRAFFAAERQRRLNAEYEARYNGKTRGESIASTVADKWTDEFIKNNDAMYDHARDATTMAFDVPKTTQSTDEVDWSPKSVDEIMDDIEALAISNASDANFRELLDMAAPKPDQTGVSQRFIERWDAMKQRLSEQDAIRKGIENVGVKDVIAVAAVSEPNAVLRDRFDAIKAVNVIEPAPKVDRLA